MLHDRAALDFDPKAAGFRAVVSGHTHRARRRGAGRRALPEPGQRRSASLHVADHRRPARHRRRPDWHRRSSSWRREPIRRGPASVLRADSPTASRRPGTSGRHSRRWRRSSTSSPRKARCWTSLVAGSRRHLAIGPGRAGARRARARLRRGGGRAGPGAGADPARRRRGTARVPGGRCPAARGAREDVRRDCRLGILPSVRPATRDAFAADLADALRDGGRYYLLAFAVEFPVPNTPLKVTPFDVRRRFTADRGWRILELRTADSSAGSSRCRRWPPASNASDLPDAGVTLVDQHR